MSLARGARLPVFIAGLEGACAISLAALGNWTGAAGFGVIAVAALIAGTTIHLTQKHNERKSNGRYRKAPEAHRAGAGRSAGDGTRARTRAYRDAVRAGASMIGPWNIPGPGPCTCSLCTGSVSGSGVVTFAQGATDDTPQPRPAGEFDGKQADFAPGVVTGTRSFDVDKLGRLRGVAYATVWMPGENVAKCMVQGGVDFITLQRSELREANLPEHSIADCAHGFYGYYEGSNDYYETGRVMGVVEGYGETIIGSRGFRASKARIVALHIPAEIPYGRRRLIARNYPGIPTFESFDAMVAECPPDDAGYGISPDTDPDFWTRKARS